MRLHRSDPIRRCFLCGAVHFCFFILFIPQFASGQSTTCSVEWNSPIQISSDSVLSSEPQIAVSGDTIHLVWFGVDTLGTVGQDGIQYARSTDGGTTFSAQQTLLPVESALTPPLISCTGNFVYVATLAFIDTFSGTSIMRSTDGGITWQPPQAILRETRPLAIVSSDTSVYIHFGNSRGRGAGMLTSTNSGLSWIVRNTTMSFRLNSLVLLQNHLHGVGNVSSDFGLEVGFYSSFTQGTSWFGPEILSKEDTLPSLRPEIAANEIGDLFVVWTEKGRVTLRRSRNEGFSWRPEQLLSPDTSGIFSDVAAGDGFVSVVWDNDFGGIGGIRFLNSNDYGATFCPPESPTIGTSVGEPVVAVEGDRVHLVWSESIAENVEILYRSGTLTEDPNSTTKPPTNFSLLQNYPNPFNGVTHIRYDVPAPTHVRLSIYNLLGQMLATLVDEDQSPKRYDVLFDAGNYASGLYFFRLQTEFFTETKKLLIVR